MANLKLSDIYATNPAAALDGSEMVEMTQSAGTVVGTVAQLRAYVAKPNIVTTITSGTITPAGDTDLVRPAALTAALTIANPSSTPADGAGFVVDLIGDGTTRALTWGSKYASRMATLPTATTVSKRHRIGFEYNAADDKLYCMYAAVQP